MFSPRGSTACDVGHKIGNVVVPYAKHFRLGRPGKPLGDENRDCRNQSGTGQRQIWANTRQTV